MNDKYIGGILDGTIRKNYKQDSPNIKIYQSYKYLLTEKTDETSTYTFSGVATKCDIENAEDITSSVYKVTLGNYLDLTKIPVKKPKTIKTEEIKIGKLEILIDILTFALLILFISYFLLI